MSTESNTEGRTLTELRQMSEAEARTTLTMAEYRKWEALNDKLDEHEQALERWDETREDATDIMLRADVGDLSESVELFGNPVEAYYAPDDPRLRDLSDRLGDAFGVDMDEVAENPESVEDVTTDDLDDDVIGDVKDILADLITVAVVEWDGTEWDNLSDEAQDAIHDLITADPPNGWGVAGAMDAWVEIAVAVEENRDERLERIQKFREPERRGNR